MACSGSIFFACGPDIKQGRNKLPGLKIYDSTPTILHMFDLPIPRDIDGRVLTKIFKEDSEPREREWYTKKLTTRWRGLDIKSGS